MDTFDIYLYISYALVIIAAIAAIVLPLVNALGNPKALLMTGIGVLILVVIYFVSYAVSGSEVTPVYTKFNVGPDLSKLVGGSLIMMYMLLFLAIVGILYTEISKIFR
jgi:hypothetical protein